MKKWMGVFAAASLVLACGSDGDNSDGSAGAGPDAGGGAPGSGGASGGNGGASAGGSSGAGQGGSAQGGSGGTSGAAGTAGAGGSAGKGGGGGVGATSGATCTSDQDCKLVDDCCNCLGIPADDQAEECTDIACLVPSCTGFGVTEAKCLLGRCTAAFECDTTPIACRRLPPTCAQGEVPSVDGTCWGPCVPVTQCASVDNCSVCDRAQHVCVEQSLSLGPTSHCVTPSTGCESDRSCQCMGDDVCRSPTVCSDGQGQLNCTCPVC